jgi:hypothetical protein
MNPLVIIIEAILLGGRLLVTFADGKIALLEPGPIYDVAVNAELFRLPPSDQLPG